MIEDLSSLQASAPRAALPPVWNVPYPRNAFFIGREALLAQLRQHLQTGQAIALSQLQAISGLGGIGKTQLAIEYAYRFHQGYQAVLWARAETTEALTSSYVTIASLLHLPEREEQEQAITVQAVKTWLQTHSGWLLILDNADDLALIPAFLPPALGGHLLLTTRAQAMGRLAHRIEVETFSPEDGALFLLRRATLLASDATLVQISARDQELALQITQELGGLPLALDQAGAYLEETGASLLDYQQLYQQHHTKLLRERRGLVADHPEPVATTWSLSFQRVEEKNPAAADLQRLCAYLAPDTIAEEIITQGAEHLGPQLASVAADALLLGQAMEALRAYSLISRDPGMHTLSVHRLVQAVLRDSMDEAERQCWWIEQLGVHLPEATEVLQQTGWYLTERARYSEAEPLLERAYRISEQERGAEHIDTARDAFTLAKLYWIQGKYPEAEPLYQHALAINEKTLGSEHPDVATDLNNLALLYESQGRYAEAEPLFQRALSIRERQVGPLHPHTAQSLNNLALLYCSQGKYPEAEPLYQRALSICEQQLGPRHPNMAASLNNLAGLYESQGRYADAEPLYQRALSIREQQLGPQHPSTATSLNNLAGLYQIGGKYAEAEPLYQRALAIYGQQVGSTHPNTANVLNNLAGLYQDQGRYEEAESFLERALAIYEQQLGAQHPHTAISLNNLANLYKTQGRYEQAEPLYQRALAIHEQQLGPPHPDTTTNLNNLANLYYAQSKYEQAEPLYQRALAICEQHLGSEHPDTTTSLNNLAALYHEQGKYIEAEPLFQRALAIYEQQLGSEHPNTQRARENYASLLRAMGRDEEVASLEANRTLPSSHAQ